MIIFVLCCLLVSTSAWLPPERCSQSHRARRNLPTEEAQVVSNVDTVVERQKQFIKEEYEKYEFLPATVYDFEVNYEGTVVTMDAPHNCSFITHKPRVVGSINCDDKTNCKLSQTVSSVESYTATEGYNWGAKVSGKFSIIEKVFEVGGEASVGGSYTCSYTKGKTVSTTQECSTKDPGAGRLVLYLVSSDLKCDLGEITLVTDERVASNGAKITNTLLTDMSDKDAENIIINKEAEHAFKDRHQRHIEYRWIKMDPDRISGKFYRKIREQAPLFNPYTDLFLITVNSASATYTVKVYYYKKTSETMDISAILPFTNSQGDAVFDYVCQFIE